MYMSNIFTPSDPTATNWGVGFVCLFIVVVAAVLVVVVVVVMCCRRCKRGRVILPVHDDKQNPDGDPSSPTCSKGINRTLTRIIIMHIDNVQLWKIQYTLRLLTLTAMDNPVHLRRSPTLQ